MHQSITSTSFLPVPSSNRDNSIVVCRLVGYSSSLLSSDRVPDASSRVVESATSLVVVLEDDVVASGNGFPS